MLNLNNISFSYDKEKIISNITMLFEDSHIYLVFSPSGEGKTTLLRLIAGLLYVDEGKVVLNGKDITNLAPHKRNIAYLFQDNTLYPNYNIYENLLMSFDRKTPLQKKDKIIKDSLINLNMAKYVNTPPKYLSQGQARKISVLKTILKTADVYLFDEPTNGLDELNKKTIFDLIKDLNKKRTSPIIIVSHDINDAFAFNDQVILFKNGNILMQGTIDELTNKPSSSRVLDLLNISYFKIIGSVKNNLFTSKDASFSFKYEGEDISNCTAIIKNDSLELTRNSKKIKAKVLSIDQDNQGYDILKIEIFTHIITMINKNKTLHINRNDIVNLSINYNEIIILKND